MAGKQQVAPLGAPRRRAACHFLLARVPARLTSVAATLTATSEASLIVRLRRKVTLLHLPWSRETPLRHRMRSSEVLLHLAIGFAPGLRRRKAALQRLLLSKRRIMLLVLAAESASRLLRSEIARYGRLLCRRRIVSVPVTIAAREVRPVIYQPPLFEASSRCLMSPHGRLPHSPIHKHFVPSPVEAIISATPPEAAAEADRSAHQESFARPREHHVRVINRHVHVTPHIGSLSKEAHCEGQSGDFATHVALLAAAAGILQRA